MDMKTPTRGLSCWLAIWLLLAGGCQRAGPPLDQPQAELPAPPPSSPIASAASAAAEPAPRADATSVPLPVETAPETSLDPKDDSAEEEPTQGRDGSQRATGEQTQVQEPPARHRILLMAPAGPLVLEVCLTDGVESLAAWRKRSLRTLLTFADKNADGVTTWDELFEEPLLLNLAAEGMSMGDERQRRTIAMSYDGDGDGHVSEEELQRFFGRNLPGEGGFQISGRSFDPFQRIAESPVTRWLDRNGDGVIATEEKRQASQRLRERDADDDGRLWPDDFAASEFESDTSMNGRYGSRTTSGPRPVRLIGADVEWNDVLNELEQVYAFGSPLTREDLGTSGRLFDWLDIDDDQSLNASEMAGLVTFPADVTASILWREGRLEELVAEDGGSIIPGREDPSATIRGGATDLDWMVRRTAKAAGMYGDGRADGGQPLGERLFAAADIDQNQYLDRSEFPRLGYGPLLAYERLDKNSDDRIDKTELALLAEIFPAFQESGIQLEVRPRADAVFAALDGNGNGTLDAREIGAAGRTLEALDGNRDGKFSTSELPSGFTLVLSDRPLANQPAATPSIGIARITPATPSWFDHMDLNRDGEIDPREFIGTPDQFQRLDADRDGFLESREVAADEQE